jgi:DNA-binding NtrC family response regulator
MCGEDPKLHSLLSSALGPEIDVAFESNREKLRDVTDRADVLLLDLDSIAGPPEQQMAVFESITGTNVPSVVMTNDASRIRAMEFLQRGASDCIRKPPSIIELKVVVRRAYEHALMKQELESVRVALRSTSSCDRLIGSSGRMQVVYDLIRRVANLNASVLILGESGTGKELVARAIHNMGNRSQQPFVAVSCGAIPETLIEAELFGHEKGAFTGSTGSRAGYLEQAGGGTLFLDEIGELSASTQVKLLRVLQERQYSRLGGGRLLPLNARVLFATHRDLDEMCGQGTFRRDLFFRVNVMSIPIPPLRERTEDIPTLARHFLAQYSEEYNKPVDEIRPNAMELLVEYGWPGNIRELEHVMQGAVIRTDGDSINKCDLPECIQQLDDELNDESFEMDSFDGLVRRYKVELAYKALADCQGNKTLAARKLKVSRAYFHRLIRVSPAMENLVSRPTAVTPLRRREAGAAS